MWQSAGKCGLKRWQAGRHRAAGADRHGGVTDPAAFEGQSRGDHGDGNEQVLARTELEEMRAPLRGCVRNQDGRQHFASLQRCLPWTGQERGQRQGTDSGRRRDLDPGIEDQQRRNAIGRRRGVAQVAANGRGCLDLAGANLTCRQLQRIEGRRQIGGNDAAPACSRADAPAMRAMADRLRLEQSIDAWRKAWSARDNAKYLAFYDKDFTSIDKNIGEWRQYKTRVNNAKSYIRVELSDLTLLAYPGEDNTVLARFYQRYESSNFNAKGWKEQLWRKRDSGEWRIVFERG